MIARRRCSLASGILFRAALAAPLILLAPACAGPAPPPASTPTSELPPRGPRLSFRYETLDGKELSPATLAGRITVIGFVTTYDVASQAEARFLAGLLRSHKPRLNVALLVLEPPENRPLVEAFAATLKLPYPIALADAATIAGEGPFAGLHHVPSIVILDREGREALRQLGFTPPASLDDLVRTVERSDPPSPPPARSG